MRTRIPADALAPAVARRFVRDQLAQARIRAGTADEVLLIVSELVTNSVRAGAEAVDLELRIDEHGIRVHVGDDAPGLPTRRASTVEDTGGRGLAIVDHLADSFRTVPQAQGKSVIVTRSWSTDESHEPGAGENVF